MALIVFILLIVLAFFGWRYYQRHPMFGATPSGTERRYYRQFPNYRKGRFRNLEFTRVDNSWQTLLKGFSEYYWSKDLRPKQPLPVVAPEENPRVTDPEEVYLTWYGHSALRLETEGLTLLIDPMLGNWIGPVPLLGHRFRKASPPDLSAFDRIDAILITHDHFDHLDLYSIERLRQSTQRFIVPQGVAAHLRRWGVPGEKIDELNWWESVRLGSLDITFAPARHFGGRSFADINRSLWGSYVLRSTTRSLYLGGDSGYGQHFQDIGRRLGPFDLVALDSGQYHAKWRYIHMTPEEALQAWKDLQGKLLLPIHWGAFSLSTHA